MTDAEQNIRQQVRAKGRVTFAEFMELALYGTGGYYTQAGRVGHGGDFYTSPHTHPMFGALIALQLEQCWQLVGSPSEFHVVEPGAGDGLLAKDVEAFAQHLEPGFAQALAYEGRDLRSVAAESDIDCLLSNELVDALPVHRVKMRDGRVQEIYVTLEGDGFVEVLDAPSTPEIEAVLQAQDARLEEGWEAEVHLAARRWMRDAASRITRGYAVTIDYGDLAEDLYTHARRRGTLSCYYRHVQMPDPYVRVGRQDMTAHANFTGLIEAGEAEGLRPVTLMTQGEFLRNLGAEAMIGAMSGMGMPASQGQRNLRGARRLLDPNGLGNFRVLVQAKNAPAESLACLGHDGSYLERLSKRWGRAVPAPLMRNEHLDLAGR